MLRSYHIQHLPNLLMEPSQSLCPQTHRLILPAHTAPWPLTRSQGQSQAPTRIHNLPERLTCFSSSHPPTTCSHSNPAQAAPCCSPAKSRAHPFTCLGPQCSSLLCGAARPAYSCRGAGGRRQMGSRKTSSGPRGWGLPAGGRQPRGAPGSRVGVQGLATQLIECDPATCHAVCQLVSHILAWLKILPREAESTAPSPSEDSPPG